jgi:hypothetical protein
MQTKKMSLADMQGKLSRGEMKNIIGAYDPRCGRISCCMAPQSPGCVPGTCYNSACDRQETCTCQRPQM